MLDPSPLSARKSDAGAVVNSRRMVPITSLRAVVERMGAPDGGPGGRGGRTARQDALQETTRPRAANDRRKIQRLAAGAAAFNRFSRSAGNRFHKAPAARRQC